MEFEVDKVRNIRGRERRYKEKKKAPICIQPNEIITVYVLQTKSPSHSV